MLKRIIIRNKSKDELGVMLEPWTVRDDAAPGCSILLEGDFNDEELVIDVGDDTFLSIWSPPKATMKVV
jgi:hypothetical protein